MKKTYIIPATEIIGIQQTEALLSASITISSDAANATNALTNEDKSWDIWGSDAED